MHHFETTREGGRDGGREGGRERERITSFGEVELQGMDICSMLKL